MTNQTVNENKSEKKKKENKSKYYYHSWQNEKWKVYFVEIIILNMFNERYFLMFRKEKMTCCYIYTSKNHLLVLFNWTCTCFKHYTLFEAFSNFQNKINYSPLKISKVFELKFLVVFMLNIFGVDSLSSNPGHELL